MASIIKVDRILDSTEINPVEIPVGLDTGIMNADQLISDTWKSQDGTENYKCKCWCNFDGTTTPPTIRASGNVSSVVRNSTGIYTVNFATPMQDVNYTLTAISSRFSSAWHTVMSNVTPTSSAVVIETRNDAYANINSSHVYAAIFR